MVRRLIPTALVWQVLAFLVCASQAPAQEPPAETRTDLPADPASEQIGLTTKFSRSVDAAAKFWKEFMPALALGAELLEKDRPGLRVICRAYRDLFVKVSDPKLDWLWIKFGGDKAVALGYGPAAGAIAGATFTLLDALYYKGIYLDPRSRSEEKFEAVKELRKILAIDLFLKKVVLPELVKLLGLEEGAAEFAAKTLDGFEIIDHVQKELKRAGLPKVRISYDDVPRGDLLDLARKLSPDPQQGADSTDRNQSSQLDESQEDEDIQIIAQGLVRGTPQQRPVIVNAMRTRLRQEPSAARRQRLQTFVGRTLGAWAETTSPAPAQPDAGKVQPDTGKGSDPSTPKVVTEDPGPKPEKTTGAAPGVGGVRLYVDSRILYQTLNSANDAANNRRLEELSRRLADERNPAKQAAVWQTFIQEMKATYKETRPLRRIDNLTAVSLKAVVDRAEKFSNRWEELPPELRTPGNLARVHGFILRPDQNDILLLGSQDPQAPALELDDLSVALRTVWKESGTPTCSLDPDPDDLSQGRAGPQKVRLLDVPGDSGFARTLLEADYTMKKVMFGTEPVQARGFTSAKELLAKAPELGASRFWFYPIQPGPGDIQVSTDGNVVLFAAGIQVFTERMALTSQGFVGTGKTIVPCEEAAASFSKHYAALAREKPILHKLETLTDLVFLGHLCREKQVKNPLLDRLCRLPHRAIRIPHSYPGIKEWVNSRYFLVGGAEMKVSCGPLSWLTLDDADMGALRKQVAAADPAGAISLSLKGASIRLPEPLPRLAGNGGDPSMAAMTKLGSMDLQGALREATQAVARDPYDPQAYAVRALVHLCRGNVDAAYRNALRARQLDPRNPVLAPLVARILCHCSSLSGSSGTAVDASNRVLELNPTSKDAYLLRGTVLSMLDKAKEARKDLEKAIELDPTFALAYARLALLESSQGELVKAKKLARKAHALNSELLEVKAILAVAEMNLQHLEPAEKLAREVLKHPAAGLPSRVMAYKVLFGIAAVQEDWSTAGDRLKQAARDLPEVGNIALLLFAAEQAQFLSRRDLAAEFMNRAERLAPDSTLVKQTSKKLAK